MLNKFLLGLLAGAALACLAHADPSAVVALKAARLFDGLSGTLRTDAVIVVQGSKILSVGGTAPAGARLIELGDATLLPGFIDAHTHLDHEIQKDYYKDF